MRVLHAITNLELAGAQSSVVAICAGLRRAGVDVHLAFSSRGGRTPGSERTLRRAACAAGIAVHDVEIMRRGLAPLQDARALAALAVVIRRVRPDIVHTHTSKAGILGRLAAWIAGVPVVVHTARGWSFYATRSRVTCALAVACERLAARATDVTLAVSNAVAVDGWTRRIGHRGDYAVVRSGVELDRFARARDRGAARAALGIAPGTAVVGAVMALTRAKAPLDVVEVMRRVIAQRSDVALVIVGYGPLASAVKLAAERAGIAARLRILGLRDDVEELYPAFDVVISTSRWEGLPRVAVEAIAAGVPVVATDVGGCREVVHHGRTGYLATPGDLDALAGRVLDALDDHGLHTRLAKLAPAVLAGHDLPTVIAQHLEIYQALTGLAIGQSQEGLSSCATS